MLFTLWTLAFAKDNVLEKWQSNQVLRTDQSLASSYTSAPDLKFVFTQTGDIAMEIKLKRRTVLMGKTHLINTGTGEGSAQLALTNDGRLELHDEQNDLVKNLVTGNPPGAKEEFGPFEARVDFDRRLRIRNAEETIIWEFPPVRTRVEMLDTNEFDFLRAGERLVSPNGQWFISINERGQVVNQNGMAFNYKPSPKKDPHVLVLKDDGTLGLFNAYETAFQLKNFSSPAPEKGDFTAMVEDEGVLTVYDQNGGIHWRMDIKPPKLVDQGRVHLAYGYDTIGVEYDQPKLNQVNCARRCMEEKECGHFVWTNYNGGTCFLKKAKFSTDALIRKVDQDTLSGYADSINWNYFGKQVYAFDCDFGSGSINLNSPRPSQREQCHTICQETASCDHYTWTNYNGGTCYLKSGGTAADAIFLPGQDSECGFFR